VAGESLHEKRRTGENNDIYRRKRTLLKRKTLNLRGKVIKNESSSSKKSLTSEGHPDLPATPEQSRKEGEKSTIKNSISGGTRRPGEKLREGGRKSRPGRHPKSLHTDVHIKKREAQLQRSGRRGKNPKEIKQEEPARKKMKERAGEGSGL